MAECPTASSRRAGRCRTFLRAALGIGLAVLAGWFANCAGRTLVKLEGERKVQPESIEQVLKEHADEWMSIDGVVGAGIGESQGKPCIKIFAAGEEEELRKRIPSQVEGFPVIIEVTGKFRSLDAGDQTGAE